MESRRVVLLTEGFLRGWLTFEHKTPLSSLREEYLLTVLERHLLLDASRTKFAAISSLVGHNPTRQSVNTLAKDLREHMELALPYLAEKTKIRSSQTKAQLNDQTFWRNLLAEKAAQVEAARKSGVVPELVPLEAEIVN